MNNFGNSCVYCDLPEKLALDKHSSLLARIVGEKNKNTLKIPITI